RAEAGPPDGWARRYEWDRQGRLSATVDGAGERTGYGYDPRDQVVAVDRPGARETYSYNSLMNLAESLGGEHRYWRDCVVAAGPHRFRYDERGRMVERITTTPGFRPRTWRYRWDGFDRLVELDTPDGARWAYAYDAFGRRVGKRRLDTPVAQGEQRIDYLWQGVLLAEAWHREGDRDRATSVERWHYAPGELRPLAKEVQRRPAAADMPAQASAFFPVVTDQLGAPAALFGVDGTSLWEAEQTLWGRARAARALVRARASHEDRDDIGGATCALRFPGQWEDNESGLHYNLNRYYDADTAQYLSPDPIGLAGGMRTQAYVDNPLVRTDPEGLAPCNKPVTRPIGELRSAGLKDAHHVIQDAAVRDLPGYNTNKAPGVQLSGPSTLDGSPHFNATQAQRVQGGGTYGAERQIGYDALRAAGHTDGQATQAIQEADAYFNSIGVNNNTVTRIPGNRR
ncbi:RHS repeat-associated core domain-containing protein, partial [Sphingomonas bacterium]|uniref:RHS repeat-associated core domain-containing protein n=1 Tax=Sphingomonas bacterium TaxID=1895847 RepID=UPI001C2D1C34